MGLAMTKQDLGLLTLRTFNDLSEWIHESNHRWWYTKDGEKLDRNKGEMIALMHSELSEMLEGERKDKMDDHLPHRKSAEVELADLFIRGLDYAGAYGFDLAGAIREKLEYNAKRIDHTYEHRESVGGKKF
jgi:NTP pyrophosphatase (non-canonical NTP hydrolase)